MTGLVCNDKLTSEPKHTFITKSFDNCTFILLGDFTQKKNGFAEDVASKIKLSLEYKEIKLFKLKEAISSLITGSSDYASALREIVESERNLPINFMTIMIEDFLFMIGFKGISIFLDFPQTIPHARCLVNSLSIYNREPVVVLSFLDCMTPSLNLISDYFRTNVKYTFCELSSDDDIKQLFAKLAESKI